MDSKLNQTALASRFQAGSVILSTARLPDLSFWRSNALEEFEARKAITKFPCARIGETQIFVVVQEGRLTINDYAAARGPNGLRKCASRWHAETGESPTKRTGFEAHVSEFLEQYHSLRVIGECAPCGKLARSTRRTAVRVFG